MHFIRLLLLGKKKSGSKMGISSTSLVCVSYRQALRAERVHTEDGEAESPPFASHCGIPPSVEVTKMKCCWARTLLFGDHQMKCIGVQAVPLLATCVCSVCSRVG